jgi:hypothetical protein
MSSKNLYRIGGIAAILSVLLSFKDIFSDVNEARTYFNYLSYLLLNNILFILAAWALYHLYFSVERRLSLAALILSIVGAAASFINWDSEILPIVWVFISALINFVIPILLFGFLAYRNAQLGMPKILYGIGILYAILWAVIYIVYGEVELGFVDNLPIILSSVWLIWTGVVLFFGKLQESPAGINIWGINKLSAYVSNTSRKYLQKPSAGLKIGVGISVAAFVGVVALAYFFYPRQAEVVENGSKIISAENADQIENTTQNENTDQIENADQSENTTQIKQLAQWNEVNSTIDDYFFNADGTLMGINTAYGIYLIDLNADSVTHLLPDQPYQHRLKAISPDGQFFVTEDNESERMRDQGQYQQRLYLWDVARQKIIMQLDVGIDYDTEEPPFPYLRVIALTFSSDGHQISALIRVEDNLGENIKSFVWNVPDGELAYNQVVESSQPFMDLVSPMSATVEYKRQGYGIDAHFSPDGDQIVVSEINKDSSSHLLTIFSFPEGDVISEIQIEEGSDVRISANGNTFVTIKGYGDLPVEYSTWGLPDGNLISTVEVADANPFDMVRAFNSPYVYIPSPTGNLLAGVITNGGNITVIKNDGTGMKEIAISGKVLTFSPKEDYIVVLSKADLMFVNIETGEIIKTIPAIQPIGGLAVHPEEDLMAFSQPDSIQIYQTSTRTLITSLSLKNEGSRYHPPSVSFSSDGKYLISRQYSDNYSIPNMSAIWDTSNWSSVNEILTYHLRSALQENTILEVFQGQPLLLDTTEEGALGFYDIRNSSVTEFNLTDPVYSDVNFADIVALKVSPDQKYLAFYGSYGPYPGVPQFALFDLSNVTGLSDLKSALASPVLSYPVEWVGEGSSGVIAFSPQGDLLAVYPVELGTFVVDLKTLETKWKISDFYSPSHLVFSQDSKLLFADGPVYSMVWDEVFYDEDGKPSVGFPVAELPIVGDFIGTSRDGKFLISASRDGVINNWGIP